MRLKSFKVHSAESCGGLLDGVSVDFKTLQETPPSRLAPHCLIGPNGSGKSQFLQLIAEVFQAAWHLHNPKEERRSSDTKTIFEMDYYVASPDRVQQWLVRLQRRKVARKRPVIEMMAFDGVEWNRIKPGTLDFENRLPSIIVGYTSGDNETLSLPFFVSRNGYSTDVRNAAREHGGGSGLDSEAGVVVPDNRLLLIDYSTHLEVLVANLLLAEEQVQTAIIQHANLSRLASFRCIVQLNHLPRLKARFPLNGRRGVQLTRELESYLEMLKAASTCWSYDPKKEVYQFDVLVTQATREAFSKFFGSPIALYRALHKLALLNDLAIPKSARDRLDAEIKTRRFASRLPEPQDEEKIFRFEQVRFFRGDHTKIGESLDYVSLSDGEHQQSQIFGVFSMIVNGNALFILDEPESHLNPQWRVKFVKQLTDLPIHSTGPQEVILTTHAPFVPSDLKREYVHIFQKRHDDRLEVSSPDIETYGADFDRVLAHCFGISPPISQLARDEIRRLISNGSEKDIERALETLGASVEKAFLSDRLFRLRSVGTSVK